MQIGYVLGRFLVLSETLVLHEVEELDRRGEEVRVSSLERPRDEKVHPSAARWLERTRYLPSLSAGALEWGLAGHARLPATSPLPCVRRDLGLEDGVDLPGVVDERKVRSALAWEDLFALPCMPGPDRGRDGVSASAAGLAVNLRGRGRSEASFELREEASQLRVGSGADFPGQGGSLLQGCTGLVMIAGLEVQQAPVAQEQTQLERVGALTKEALSLPETRPRFLQGSLPPVQCAQSAEQDRFGATVTD